jgi:hypothetical protein
VSVARLLVQSVLLALASLAFGATDESCVSSGELREANPVWGGKNVYLTPRGEVWVQDMRLAERGLEERRHSAQITTAVLEQFGLVIERTHLFKLKTSKRRPLPDESFSAFVIVLCSGRTHAATVFRRDAKGAMNSPFEWFDGLGGLALTNPPLYKSVPDWSWRPTRGESR